MKNQKDNFVMIYDGKALSENEMDLSLFGNAVLGIDEIIKSSADTIYGKDCKIQIKIKGTPKAGSLELNFVIEIGKIFNMFNSNEFNSIKNLLEVIGISAGGIGGGLFGLMKWLKNHKIINETRNEDNTYTLIKDNKESLIVNENVLKLRSNKKATEAIRSIITEPLYKKDIEYIEFNYNKHKVNIPNTEVEYYDKPVIETVKNIEKKIVTARLKARHIWFEKNHKWSFTAIGEEATLYAKITDKDFLQKIIENKEVFAPGDLYKVKMQITSYYVNEERKEDYEIIKVEEHKPHNKHSEDLFEF